MPSDGNRSEEHILGELRDVERFLQELPPHSSAAGREDLTARREQLQRELASVRRERDDA